MENTESTVILGQMRLQILAAGNSTVESGN